MIGGGSYDEGNQGLKIDQWIDIGHIFQSAQVTYSGEYKQGNKIGKWDSWWKSKYQQNLKIGGGYYDKGGQSDKIGLWVDISDEFFEESQVIFNGEYKNGKNWQMGYLVKNLASPRKEYWEKIDVNNYQQNILFLIKWRWSLQ
ncbi:unnamed protein product [Paramecium octaurelia]|uniref:Uncharacterized protein n=1 Tax=Paramecium octaurelia TaxID=43137 RepID=A0A8S1UZN0_PAROT|nr:unnamed protein product [Paramecium octaurelia]